MPINFSSTFFGDTTGSRLFSSNRYISDNAWLIGLSCTASGALMFYLGCLYGRRQAELSHQSLIRAYADEKEKLAEKNTGITGSRADESVQLEQEIAAKVEQQIAARIMNHGWRPGVIKLGNIDFYVSYFKPTLLASTAVAIVKNTSHDTTSLLLNIQSRVLRDGVSKDVADFPCGFYQSNQPDLAYKKTLLKRVAEERQANGTLTAHDLQVLVRRLDNQKINETVSLRKLPMDKTVSHTAKRELNEETGQKGLSFASARHFKSRVVQGGSYLYNYVELNYTDTVDGWVQFSPEKEEGVRSSQLVALNSDNFQFSVGENGKVEGYVYITDSKQWIEIKPYDDVAAMMVYYLMTQHGMTFEGITLDTLQYLETEALGDDAYEHQRVLAL